MSNLSYFMLTDQEKTIINQTHVDWFGYGFDAFIEYFPLVFIVVFLCTLVAGTAFAGLELERMRGNSEIKKPEPKISGMVSRILTFSLLFTIFMTGVISGLISYEEVLDTQSYAAQPYAAGVKRHASDKETDKKLMKHGFKIQDILQETSRTETYEIVPGTLKKASGNSEYKNIKSVEDDKGSCGAWAYYNADIIVGYVGNEAKTKKYEWRSYEPCDQDDASVKYVKATTSNQKPILRVTYNRVEDVRFRGVPNAVDGGYSSRCSEFAYLDKDMVFRSCESRGRVEVVVPVS